jgi:hypothetical protein
MGRFDTKWLIRLETLFALGDLARPVDRQGASAASAEIVVLDLDSSANPTL